MTSRNDFARRYETHLRMVAENLRHLIHGHLEGVAEIERVVARAKSPESFAEKAKTVEHGQPKYRDPLAQIQDQIGVRVIVLFMRSVEPVATQILTYFSAIEDTKIVPDSQSEFGYFGRHLILKLPLDAVPVEVQPDEVPAFFELQVKTLFQHAWSEANHDLGYKSRSLLSNEDQRLLAFASAQAWGADRAFEELMTNDLTATPGA